MAQVILRPIGDGLTSGNHQGFPTTTSTYFDKVNEASRDNYSSWVAVSSTNAAHLFLTSCNLDASANISSVEIHMWATKRPTGTNNGRIWFVQGSTQYLTYHAGVSVAQSTFTDYSCYMRYSLATSANWTAAEVNTGKFAFGFRATDAAPAVYVTQMYAYVNYDEYVPPADGGGEYYPVDYRGFHVGMGGGTFRGIR
jgi:hypothetical protein